MEEGKFRNKISWMMFLFSIFVIWVHSYNTELFVGGAAASVWESAAKIEKFVSVGLGQAAVPGFFLISSYLFFRNYTPDRLRQKWAGRMKSVLIPYVAWNTVYYLLYTAATRLPAVRVLVGKEPVPFGLSEFLDAIFHYSCAPVFWYLYQLILLILLSPVIYYLVKNRVVGAVYLALLLVAVSLHLDLENPNTDALTYYSVAAYLAVHGKSLVEGAWSRRRAWLGACGLALCAALYLLMGLPGASVLWTVFYRLFLPVSLWLLVREDRLPAARGWMKQSLYLYAVHYLIVRFLNKGAAMMLRPLMSGQAMTVLSLVFYFAMPAAVVCVSYGSARLLFRFLPRVWNVLSGGRPLEAANKYGLGEKEC